MTQSASHREVILAGSGGQGLILSAILLAEAAMLEGRNVVQTQSFGIATRIASDLGNVGSVNILALGTIAMQTGIVRQASLEQMIRKRFNGAAVEQNLQVLAAGAGLGAS